MHPGQDFDTIMHEMWNTNGWNLTGYFSDADERIVKSNKLLPD